MILPRHEAAIRRLRKQVPHISKGLKVICIVYDGNDTPPHARRASWYSDAPEADVKAICKKLGE